VLFTFPSRYSFTIGRQEYLALDGGPPSFPHERPSTWYSGGRTRRSVVFVYGAVTLSGLPFLTGSTNDRLGNSAGTFQGPDAGSYNPRSETAGTYLADRVWAIPVSLATTQGMISFPPATEMFQFAGLPPPGLFDSTRSDWASPQPGFPIRTSSDHGLLATPRGLTQPATSFIGSWRQGIHLVPLVA
jgi:hypothetical protein